MSKKSNNDKAKLDDTPGQLLRVHREKKGMSIHEIAKRTNLDIKVVNFIEQDSDEEMPDATYVRGYLRSYAKIVDADPDHIIALYNSDSPQPPSEVIPKVKQLSQVTSSDKPVKAFTYLLTLGLVLLLLVWYQSNFIVDTSMVTSSNSNNSQKNINGVDISYDVVIHPSSWKLSDNNSEAEPLTSKSTIYDDILRLQSDNGDQTLATYIEENEREKIGTIIGTGSDVLYLNVKKKSWVEVYDANDKKLFLDNAFSGQQYSIHGTAPFKVLLGFSPGVTVKFNGMVFNHSRYSINSVARFILPE
jgi:cytoskeleton protein RodZ